MSGSLLSQSNSVLIFSSGSVCCFFKTCLWFLNVLIDAVKTSVQITEPRGSYLKERWQKNVSVHGTAQRDLLFLFFRAGAGGRAGGTPRAPLCRRGAAVSPRSGSRCCAGRNREPRGEEWLRKRRVRRVDVASGVDYYGYCNSKYVFAEEGRSELRDLVCIREPTGMLWPVL